MNGIAIHRTTVVPRQSQSDANAVLVPEKIAIGPVANDEVTGDNTPVEYGPVRGPAVHLRQAPIESRVRNQRPSTNPAIELTRRVSVPSPDLGQILLGDGREKITIDGLLGAGGMGVVYAGFHRILNQSVVVKVIRSEYVHIPELVARFQREAEILASIHSPGVVKLLDCDVTSTGLPYMVLERLQGHDLSDLVEARGKLQAPEALSIALDTANALAPLHSRGIVHRDIKPDNIYLHTNSSGVRQIKLLDFGVALAAKKRVQLTLPGTTMGSLHYMSPEQLKDCHAVTPASDVWSLGVVLFQLLSGELPFRGVSEAEYTTQVLTQNAMNLRAVAPGVTKELAQIVAKCLHKDAWKRYDDAAQLASSINRYMAQERSKLRIPNPLASVRPKTRHTDTHRAARPTNGKRRWSKSQLAAAGVFTGLALGHLMPNGVRNELSSATLSAFATPLQLFGR